MHSLPGRLRRASVALAACATLLAVVSPTSPAAGGPEVRPIDGQIIVGFEAGVAPGARADAVRAVGGQTARALPGLDARIIRVPASSERGALERLRTLQGVRYAEPDALVRPAETVPNDFWWPSQWGQATTQTDRAWDLVPDARGIVVAVLDSGVQATHPDLAGNLVAGYDEFNGDSDPSDDYGHGTPVAGVVAGRAGNGQGVSGYCGSCSIMAVKITGSDGYASWSAMAAGISWAVAHGARVLNLSFAGSTGSTAVRDAIRSAHDAGAIVTVAAGNYGTSSPTYPGAYPGALAVAATMEDDTLRSTSSFGSWVQVAAPGCHQTTRLGGTYAGFCGTSSAAPAVAGIAAALLAARPSATGADVEAALEQGAVPIGSGVQYGRVDAWHALAALGAVAPSPAAPVATAPPTAVAADGGLPAVAPAAGTAMGASGGGWTGDTGIALAYQWQRCDTSGAGCTAIAAATQSTYTPVAADAGFTLRATVTASNALGRATSRSPATQPVGGGSAPGAAPANTAPPAISGAPQAGSTLSASAGTWAGTPTAYAYQWLRCDAGGVGCASISGATSATYSAATADVGDTLRVAVTASNAYGSSTSTSAATGVVSAPARVTDTFSASFSSRRPSQSFTVRTGAGSADATLTFAKASTMTLTILDGGGATVASATGPSALRLSRSLPAGTYTYVVSGSPGKGSISFTLTVAHEAT